jgi:hypothetical protein
VLRSLDHPVKLPLHAKGSLRKAAIKDSRRRLKIFFSGFITEKRYFCKMHRSGSCSNHPSLASPGRSAYVEIQMVVIAPLRIQA